MYPVLSAEGKSARSAAVICDAASIAHSMIPMPQTSAGNPGAKRCVTEAQAIFAISSGALTGRRDPGNVKRHKRHVRSGTGSSGSKCPLIIRCTALKKP